jgi:hypothetical protein
VPSFSGSTTLRIGSNTSFNDWDFSPNVAISEYRNLGPVYAITPLALRWKITLFLTIVFTLQQSCLP